MKCRWYYHFQNTLNVRSCIFCVTHCPDYSIFPRFGWYVTYYWSQSTLVIIQSGSNTANRYWRACWRDCALSWSHQALIYIVIFLVIHCKVRECTCEAFNVHNQNDRTTAGGHGAGCSQENKIVYKNETSQLLLFLLHYSITAELKGTTSMHLIQDSLSVIGLSFRWVKGSLVEAFSSCVRLCIGNLSSFFLSLGLRQPYYSQQVVYSI